jgi:photosystem II stability/assembly factor-like uncharacterized protein
MTHLLFASLLLVQSLASDFYGVLQWRSIGPFRGGRTKAATGVPSRPGTFYIGAVDGGVWRTNDYGRTWEPLFDAQPTGSIGALAVSASNPDVIYAGSGEGIQRPDLSVGDGVYRSNDAGKTWKHLGLRDGQQIPQIVVDPRDPKRLFVAVLGHPYGPNEERGLFRSLDGGETFSKVLYRDADTGAADVAFDPADPQTVYASLWEARHAPWENGEFSGPGSGLFKSTDGGTTWRPIGKGLPEHVGRIGIGIAPSNGKRIFVTAQAKKGDGLYRSDDAGESFVKITEDDRIADRADDFAEVKVHPLNPDIVFTASVVVWKSIDGGKTWSALRGAPGGDDYQKLWINPLNPDNILIASDQGAIVTVNGGQTFSSWYNQPTAQMFHVNTDNAFPYRVCGGQQDSGSACVASRGPDGAITARDWHPAGVEEYGYAVPDPLDPDVIYGGRITRWDRRTGQVQDIAPVAVPGPDYRVVRTQPVVFSPIDPHTLYFAANSVYRTTDGGKSWTRISPDLTRKTWAPPVNVGKYRNSEEAKAWPRGVVYALAPSPKDRLTLWAGTDDGLLHVTRDGGKKWQDVTPAALSPWAKVSVIEASHFDVQSAYAAINTLRLDDLKPHVLRTRDGGKTWQAITAGLPDGGVVNVVREDPRKRGLLFAGTEQAVFFSTDDGDHWAPLRNNMPATSIRDLAIKDDDLIAATHGRGFWILDNFSALREPPPDGTHLFQPATALRIRSNTNTDTPPPPDEPSGKNPPDGAVIDYALQSAGPVVLEITEDATGRLVRHFSSDEKPAPEADEGNVPRWWIRPAAIPSAAAGLHRFVWDLHYPAPSVKRPGFPIAAIAHDTPREPRGPWVVPGSYTVWLRAGGKTFTRGLTVKLDPRLKTAPAALAQQLAISLKLVDALGAAREALESVRKLREQKPAPELEKKLAALVGTGEEPEPGSKQQKETPTLSRWASRLSEMLQLVQESDLTLLPPVTSAAETLLRETTGLLDQWKRIKP